MIIAFDPAHNECHYAIWCQLEERLVSRGKIPRKDMKFFCKMVKDILVDCTVGIVESQYVQIAKTKATMAGIAAGTLKVCKAAGNIEAIMHLHGMEVLSVHPKTWQAIFSNLKGYATPVGRVAVKKASSRLAKSWIGGEIKSQDEADCICMLFWFLGKDGS